MQSNKVSDQSHHNSQSFYGLSSKLAETNSRLMVIDSGIQALQQFGADSICKVCISNGGSCCNGCGHLKHGLGCQQRNTSCTAWLCGFLKYLLYETGHLQQWNDFWEEVPGREYREDFTPDYFFLEKQLPAQNLRILSEALAADLLELARAHIAIGFILTLREKIDKNIDRLYECSHDHKKQVRIRRNIKILSSPFHRFNQALILYKQENK